MAYWRWHILCYPCHRLALFSTTGKSHHWATKWPIDCSQKTLASAGVLQMSFILPVRLQCVDSERPSAVGRQTSWPIHAGIQPTLPYVVTRVLSCLQQQISVQNTPQTQWQNLNESIWYSHQAYPTDLSDTGTRSGHHLFQHCWHVTYTVVSTHARSVSG